MLNTLLEWMGAGDQAIRTMGPVLSIALAWLGGFGFTQAVKFPIAQLLDARWHNWVTRTVAVMSSWACAHYVGDLPNMVEFIVAMLQPAAYSVGMGVLRHWWPWLEAGKVLGSAKPSQEAQDAMAQRKAGQ